MNSQCEPLLPVYKTINTVFNHIGTGKFLKSAGCCPLVKFQWYLLLWGVLRYTLTLIFIDKIESLSLWKYLGSLVYSFAIYVLLVIVAKLVCDGSLGKFLKTHSSVLIGFQLFWVIYMAIALTLHLFSKKKVQN